MLKVKTLNRTRNKATPKNPFLLQNLLFTRFQPKSNFWIFFEPKIRPHKLLHLMVIIVAQKLTFDSFWTQNKLLDCLWTKTKTAHILQPSGICFMIFSFKSVALVWLLYQWFKYLSFTILCKLCSHDTHNHRVFLLLICYLMF